MFVSEPAYNLRAQKARDGSPSVRHSHQYTYSTIRTILFNYQMDNIY